MAVNSDKRKLGKSGPTIGPMGIGTWAIGGPFYSGAGCRYPSGAPLGYGRVDDKESIRAIHCAIDHGARLFDTADAYGTGHAERILGTALGKKRDDVLIATKFGNRYQERTKELNGRDFSPAYIRQACLASLERLKTDRIDLYQLHIGDLPPEKFDGVADTLDSLCGEGLIRAYGWSTDDPERASLLSNRDRAVAVQFDMNVFDGASKMLDVCETHEFAGLTRTPLAMGFLSGKFTAGSSLPDDDIRSSPPAWLRYFQTGGGIRPEWSARLASIREILTSEGRTLAQGALAWIWARSARTIPIPGVRTAAQAEENLRAVDFGPLRLDQMDEIARLINGS